MIESLFSAFFRDHRVNAFHSFLHINKTFCSIIMNSSPFESPHVKPCRSLDHTGSSYCMYRGIAWTLLAYSVQTLKYMQGAYYPFCPTVFIYYNMYSPHVASWGGDGVLSLSSASVSSVGICLVILMLVVVFYRKDSLCCRFRPYRTEHCTVRTTFHYRNHIKTI